MNVTHEAGIHSTAGIQPSYLRNGAAGIGEGDLCELVSRKSAIETIAVKGALSKCAEEIRLLFELVCDYRAGRYVMMPWVLVAAIVFALLYVINPFDLMPDFIPVLGLIDDVSIVALCVSMLGAELDRYRRWKATQHAHSESAE
jgi:uncharacterized membrane protein YkvA (DUF1232 family)